MIPNHARIVIIGGGAVGCSIAYHLAKLGEKDVVLLEKSGLTQGSTWHAAGLVGQLRSKRNLTRMMQYSVELYGKLAAETGQEIEWKPVGSLRLAGSQDRWSELKRAATTARSFDFEMHLVTPKEAIAYFPLLNPAGIVGAAFVPSDGHVEPSSLTQAYAKGARAGGVRIVEGVTVTGFGHKDRRISTVETNRGSIACEIVVNAAGIWARDMARLLGIDLAAGATEHQYMVTAKIPDLPANLPTLRDPDRGFYLKPDVGALAMGGWEPNTKPWGLDGIPAGFGRELFPGNMERFEQILLPAAERLPILGEVGIRTLINGPIPVSADGEPILGLAPQFDNFYLACGFTSGIAASGGAGRALAEWIVAGEPSMDLWAFDARRFGPHHGGQRYLAERMVESYYHYYTVHWPVQEHDAGRGGRRSPLYPTLKDRGCSFGSKFGWERPNWFARDGASPVDVPAFEDKPGWFDAVGAEHRAIREAVAVIDQSSFTKFELSGPGALNALQRLAANDMDRPAGTVIYTQLCNARGGIEADLTITRLAEDRFYIVTGSGFGVRDGNWIGRHLPRDGSVALIDVTSARAVINLCGPRARDVLAAVADADVSNAAFPYMQAREFNIGYAPVRALRVTYVGELGWELHVPTEYARHVYETLWLAGRDHGMVDAGYRAIESLRLEKRYLYWGAELTPDYNPYEAGLGFCVALGKDDFIGREALLRIKQAGPKRRLAGFSTPGWVPLHGGEAILRRGKAVSVTTSAGYGHTVVRSIALGYLPTEETGTDGFEIEAFGRRYPAERSDKPLYDAGRARIAG
ncbi:MAG: FAD-dependent oxidoreductase [Alphaproteobacteria bacterium]|nr:FAD-dependent oxidoreductase [Alphaproteobacteria bacterium]